MAVLQLNVPFATREPFLRVENRLNPGRHLFQLVVVSSTGAQSERAVAAVTVLLVPPIPGPPIPGSGSPGPVGVARPRRARKRKPRP